MHSASVGFHCPECAKTGAQKVQRGIARSSRGAPTVVYVLIAINVVIFGLELATGSGSGISGGIADDGYLYGPAVEFSNEYYRIVSSGFLHGSILHLGMNMYGLYVLGPVVLALFGRARFLAIYAVALLGGAAAVLLFAWSQPTLGASGALLGLAGAIAGAFTASGRPLNQIPMLQIIAINLALPLFIPTISFWGHFGGIAAGFAAGFVAQRFAQVRSKNQALEFACYVGIGLVCLALALYGAHSPIGGIS